ncbi:hypothetical protein J2T60_001889 [Natronospira proteinivora]|uniref:Uncharacterized protein n=1 Tax=Natronospira proteinivora TaxID=1807133 RepID=A0ABT1G992_9GAMM|nr:type IV toxin-antitoxin system AbiEi family antitoxin [Natronospira proteinivora]MCP1727889.1 hypothetical protein [Natronospira proteinivora]
MDQPTKFSLIETARQVLAQQAGVRTDEPKTDRRFNGITRPRDGIEAFLDLRFPEKGPDIQYAVLVRRQVTAAVARNVAAVAQRLPVPGPYLLVAERIDAEALASLKTLGIQYVDGIGNVYLRSTEPYVHIRLSGKHVAKSRPAKVVRAFQPAGLKVIFTLLSLYSQRNSSYRTLARYSGVALGTVAGTIEDLERLGYCRSRKGGRIFDPDREDELLDRWVEGYLQKLRPRLGGQRFRAHDPDWWRSFELADFRAHDLWLGGEPAASVLTQYLRPGRVTVYGRPKLNELARRLRLSRDDEGELELLQPFWDFDKADAVKEYGGKRLVPPLLVYADLVGTGDARCLDAAGLIREQFL